MSIQFPKRPEHPALVELHERGQTFENRVADTITRLAGSMPFIYVHIAWFTLWIALSVEDYPYGLLTMIVSLEAIFLSTFVMISQNRADEKRQAIADHEWETVQLERRQNEELLALSRRILDVTQRVETIALQSGHSSESDQQTASPDRTHPSRREEPPS